ncbi:1-deoxy-D-xylulose-5-phosphate synthase [Treponema sp.]|uniref:1-deoxy-D-xylulose-5-phosphate synthase n=1 Tax=Treponema sp. TaxID=166 RepID=UPI00298E312D|nr:1-deoxy-D-xylulose-5-phosphate synthase [Treponema sp.]MCR5612268.1 1-deoxy-D-xylulose-5-phosphate synthase [Treponema sp.]
MSGLFFWRLFTILSSIHSPEDLKNISKNSLRTLASELRKKIIEVVGKNGGHLASNLGVVELTIALHRVFNNKNDAIVWDVSHQCYAHKMLTGRLSEFNSLRQHDGLSGFTKMAESPYDYFDNGHASTSISSSLGLLTARSLLKKYGAQKSVQSETAPGLQTDGKVVAVIGDGALTGGLAFEGLCHAGQLQKNLIIVLNDNQMSIDSNNGSLSRYLSRLTMSSHYQKISHGIDYFAERAPLVNKFLPQFIAKFKRGLKGLFLANNLFVELGYEYVGPLNGHDINELELVFNRVKKLDKPVVVHVVTKKGKGYSPAENDPQTFHGIGPFCITDGSVEKFDAVSFTESFAKSIVELGQKNPCIVTITAAMAKGTGLDTFARHFPDRFFDVGIAEEHAVTFAGGLAKGGLVPVVCIYSTFIQRSIDQIIHDVALPDFHVVFVFDRSGAVPNDGETHQGIFDIALLRPIPNMTILSPCSSSELEMMLNAAVDMKGPVAIRYPKLTCPNELDSYKAPLVSGRGILLTPETFAPSLSVQFDEAEATGKVQKTLIITTGSLLSEVIVASRARLEKNIYTDIYNLRYIKPLDEEYLCSLCKGYEKIIITEDGIKNGGVGEYIECLLRREGISNIKLLAFPQKFISQGTRLEVLTDAGLSSRNIENA